MAETVRFCFCAFFMASSLFVMTVGVIGVFKFKDALTRMHAAAMNDTCGILFAMVALAIARGFSFATLKFAIVVVMLWITSPVSSHLIGRLKYKTDEMLDIEERKV